MISTCIDRTAGLVIHTATGELTLDEITEAFEARLKHRDFRPGMNVLWDYRRATISSLSTQDVQQLVAFNQRIASARGGGLSAIVAPKDVDYGISRMFQIHSQDLPWHTMVFRNLESALEWFSDPG